MEALYATQEQVYAHRGAESNTAAKDEITFF
jgi:hypothetical protein